MDNKQLLLIFYLFLLFTLLVIIIIVKYYSKQNESYGNNTEITPPIQPINIKRPFYIMPHLCNDINKVQHIVDNNIQIIECDLMFKQDGIPDKFYHGFPCDIPPETRDKAKWIEWCSYKTDAVEYFKGIGNLQRKPLGLLLDLKLDTIKRESSSFKNAGSKVSEYLYNFVFKNKTFQEPKIILSLGTIDDKDFIYGIRSHSEWTSFLHNLIGFEFSYMNTDEEVQKAAEWFDANGITKKWFGGGDANLFPYKKKNMLTAANNRDTTCDVAHINKLWYWTSDSKTTWSDLLNIGVDSICTNDYKGLLKFINDKYSHRYYIATEKDDIFSKAPGFQSYKITFKTGDIAYAGTDSNVYIQLHGILGSTNIIGPLNKWMSSFNVFERNSLDSIQIVAENVDKITGISVCTDNTGISAAWYLEYIIINPGCLYDIKIFINTWLDEKYKWITKDA